MKYFVIRHGRMVFLALILVAITSSLLGTTIERIGLQLVGAGFVMSIPLLLLYRTEHPTFAAIYGATIALSIPTVYRMNCLSNTAAIDWIYSFACVGIGVLFLPAIAKRFTESFVGA